MRNTDVTVALFVKDMRQNKRIIFLRRSRIMRAVQQLN